MSTYEALLIGHIASVVIWLGAAVVFSMLSVRAERAADHEAKARINADAEWLAPRLFIPASLGTLIFGVLLVLEGSFSFDQLWVTLALAGFLVSFLTGILYFKPEGERLTELIERHGPAHSEVLERMSRMEVIGRLELVVLFLVAADMVVKPTGDDTGVLIGGAVVLVLGAAAAIALRGAAGEPAPPGAASTS